MMEATAVSGIPELLSQWDHEKNAGLDPSKLRVNSNRKAWWKCREGHSWEAVIASRKKHGCPYCSGRYPVKGVNDIPTVCPEMAADWDYESNAGTLPEDYTRCSEKKVWWLCENGHSYFQAVKIHTRGGKCPYCYGKQTLKGFNDLGTENPPFLQEWDFEKNMPVTPADLRIHSNKKVWWKCGRGHSWQISVNHRSTGSGCPYCSGKAVLKGFNDLATVLPSVAGEWDYEKNEGLAPDMVSMGCNRRVWWKCREGHSWQATVYSRRIHGCPYCGRRKLLTGFNDLLTVDPALAAQWDYIRNVGIRPEDVTPCAGNIVWWKCEKGHSWKAKVANRSYGTGCPYCSGKMPVTGENDLGSRHPELLVFWDWEKNVDIAPENVTCSSARKVWWKCEKGHSWKTAVHDIVYGSRCPYCAGKKALAGFNDLKTVLPDVAREWDYKKNGSLTPEQVTYCCSRKIWWRCSQGHSWQAGIDNRKSGTGCPYCSGNTVLKGENDLATLMPYLAEEWDNEKNRNLKPENVSPGSNRKVWWRCAKGHSWKSSVCERASGSGCPCCAGKTIVRTRFIT